jgi:RHS repeat-associated protein
VVARYSQGLNIDEPLAMLRSSTTSYYEADGLGSISSLTSSAGAVANTYTYDSFGNVTNSTGTLRNPFSYTAREFDSETGLYYYRARYYDPNTGRFVSEDPLEFAGGDVSFYRYVWDQPLGYRDPSGRWGVGFVTSVGAGFGLSPAMGAGSVSGQTGVFWGGPGGTTIGNTISYGGFIPDPHSNGILSAVNGNTDNSVCTCAGSNSSPTTPSKAPKSWGAGAWFGAGAGFFVTNANSPQQLKGPFDNFEINTPWATMSLQLGYDDQNNFIWQFSVPRGPSLGAGIARYKTNTCVMP